VEHENHQHDDVPAAFLSAVCIGAGIRELVQQPENNTMLNIGSAPNPTPEGLRRHRRFEIRRAYVTEPGFVVTHTQATIMPEYVPTMSTAHSPAWKGVPYRFAG